MFCVDFLKITSPQPLISVRPCADWLLEKLSSAGQPLLSSSFSDLEVGLALYNMFKPNPDININLSTHALHDIEFRTLQSCTEQREIHEHLYSELCWNRYGKFRPGKLALLEELLKGDRDRLAELRKLLVYRGEDNIHDLKLFYLYLISEHQLLEQSGFTLEAATRFASHLYKPYYTRFRDILLPLLTSVLLIVQAGISATAPSSILPCILNPDIAQPSLQVLVKEFTVEDEVSKFEMDNAKRHLILQKKLHELVVDEYTQKGVQRNKERTEEDFRETFNADLQAVSLLSDSEPIDKIYAYMRSSTLDGYKFALRRLSSCENMSQFAVLTQLLRRKESPVINIYSEASVPLSLCLSDCTSILLENLNTLAAFYSSETTKSICLLLNTILDQKIFTTELYKLTSSCEHAVDKIIELNQTLPKQHHVDCSQMMAKLMEIRKLEMKNWECMLKIKEIKIEKADLVELVHLCRVLYSGEITQQQMFALLEKFLKEANLCTFVFRLEVLHRVRASLPKALAYELDRVVGFYRSFLDEHLLMTTKIRTDSKEQIK